MKVHSHYMQHHTSPFIA